MVFKKTLVIGASTNPSRYSYMTVNALRNHGHDVVALAKREGRIADVEIQTKFSKDEIHTVTLYVGQQHQTEYYDSVIDLNPVRVIFNPGTENYEFAEKLREKGIEAIKACTLVLLSTGQY